MTLPPALHRAARIAVPVLLVAWRLGARPWSAAWADAVLWIAAWWILQEFDRDPARRERSMAALAWILFILHTREQLPLTVEMLRSLG